MNTILQIPLKKDLREQAQRQAERMGFSSLQEPVRVFLKQLAQGKLSIVFENEMYLSEKNKRRYEKMVDEVEQGMVKTKTFSNLTSLMDDLNQ